MLLSAEGYQVPVLPAAAARRHPRGLSRMVDTWRCLPNWPAIIRRIRSSIPAKLDDVIEEPAERCESKASADAAAT
jgi:hypothetical protein